MFEHRATLEVRYGGKLGQSWELKPPCTIGRSQKCNVAVDDAEASRLHCVVEFDANEFLVRDNDSSHGTLLNGRRVRSAALRHGDVLTIGNTELLFQVGIAPRAEPTQRAVLASTRLSLGVPPFDQVDANSPVERLAEALAKYKLLYQLRELFSRAVAVTDVFPFILEQIFEVVSADWGVLLLGSRPETIERVASHARVTQEPSPPLSRTLLARVLGAGEALLVRDSSLDVRLNGAESALSNRARSILCVPLSHGEHRFGALQLEMSREGRTFLEADLELAAAIGREVGQRLAQQQLSLGAEALLERAALRRFASPAAEQALAGAPTPWKRGTTALLDMLFIDWRLLGAVLASGSSQAETAHAALHHASSFASRVVLEHEGTIARMDDAGLLAIWGAPLPSTDSARKAARAALTVAEACRQSAHPEATGLRLALHRGVAFAGEIGPAFRREYTAMGPEVEKLRPLCDAAPPTALFASEAFHEELSTQLQGDWVPAAKAPSGTVPRRFLVRAFKDN